MVEVTGIYITNKLTKKFLLEQQWRYFFIKELLRQLFDHYCITVARKNSPNFNFDSVNFDWRTQTFILPYVQAENIFFLLELQYLFLYSPFRLRGHLVTHTLSLIFAESVSSHGLRYI